MPIQNPTQLTGSMKITGPGQYLVPFDEFIYDPVTINTLCASVEGAGGEAIVTDLLVNGESVLPDQSELYGFPIHVPVNQAWKRSDQLSISVGQGARVTAVVEVPAVPGPNPAVATLIDSVSVCALIWG